MNRLRPIRRVSRAAPILLLTASCGVGGVLAASAGGGGGGGGGSNPPPPPQVTVVAPSGPGASNLVTIAYVLRDDQVKRETKDGPPGGAEDPRVRVHAQWQVVPEGPSAQPVGDPDVWFDMSPADVPQAEPTRAVPLGQHTFVWNTLPDLAAYWNGLPDLPPSESRFRFRVRIRVLAEYEETSGLTRGFRSRTATFQLDIRPSGTIVGADADPPTDVDTFPVDLRPNPDAGGNGFLVADFGANIVERVDDLGLVRRVLGFGIPGDTVGAGKSPGVARLPTLIGLEVDADGNLFTNHSTSLLVTNRTDGAVAFGGTTVPAFTVARLKSSLADSRDVRLLGTDALLYLDQASQLMAFNRQDPDDPMATPIVLAGVSIGPGETRLIAGGGASTDDDVPALTAQLSSAVGLAIGPDDEVYVVESAEGLVRVVNTRATDIEVGGATVAPGAIRTVAGGGAPVTPRRDAGQPFQAVLAGPTAIDVSPARELFVTDSGNLRVVLVNLGTAPTRFAATDVDPAMFGTVVGTRGAKGGVGSKAEELALSRPNALTLDTKNNLLVADARSVILVNRASTAVTSYGKTAGGGRTARVYDASRRGGVPLTEPRAVHASSPTEIYFSDRATVRVLNLDATDRVFGGESASPGASSIVGGGSVPGYGGDGGSARGAAFSSPSGLAAQGSQRLFVADTGNDRVRLINLGDPRRPSLETDLYLGRTIAPGAVDTVVGGGVRTLPPSPGEAVGDGLAASSALLLAPEGVAIGPDGLLWVCDTGHHRIRVVNPSDTDVVTVAGVDVAPGTIATIVGDGSAGFSGDGAGPWTTNAPSAIALDTAGVLYFAERGNSRIRCLNLTSATVNRAAISIPKWETRTLVGTGTSGNGGDGGDGPSALIAAPRSLFVQSFGSDPIALYFSDEAAHVVRMLNLSKDQDLALAVDADGNTTTTIPAASVYTVAGGPNTPGLANPPGFAGDGSVPEQVRFNAPFGVAVTTAGGANLHFFVADRGNDRLRRFGAPPLVTGE